MPKFLKSILVLTIAAGLAAAEGNQNFENKLIKVTIPADWAIKDDSQIGLMMILPSPGNPEKAGVYIKIEGPNWSGTPEDSIATMVKDYKGSAPQIVFHNNRTYVQTSYEFSGSKQTMLVSKKETFKLTVTLEGSEHQQSQAVKLILSTLYFK